MAITDYRTANYRLVKAGHLTLVGPTTTIPTVDLCGRVSEAIIDPDLVGEFNRGMAAGPWLDWVADRHPKHAWAADLYGQEQVRLSGDEVAIGVLSSGGS